MPVRKRVSARKVWLAAAPSRRCGALLLPLGTGINLPSATPGPPVLATDVGVHVVRVRARSCREKREKGRVRKRERERERWRDEGKEKENGTVTREGCEREPSFSLARGWGRPFSRVLNIFMMAAGAGGAAWKWRVGGGL